MRLPSRRAIEIIKFPVTPKSCQLFTVWALATLAKITPKQTHNFPSNATDRQTSK